MKNSYLFSVLFKILKSNSIKSSSEWYFNLLLGWVESIPKTSPEISYLTNATRDIPGGILDWFITDSSEKIRKGYDHIKKKVIQNIINQRKLKKDLLEFKNLLDISDDTNKYLTEISEVDMALFVSCLLYLAIIGIDRLPDIDAFSPEIESIHFTNAELSSFQKIVWYSSQQNYFLSHRKGNRFAELSIIERLLPKGCIVNERFDFYFDCSKKEFRSISDIYKSTDDHVAITGEGGIGKTTFLQSILEMEFGTEEKPASYEGKTIVPIFIELNRCPREIDSWYDEKLNRTNFITRQIADSIQSTDHKYRNYSDLLEKLEDEFKYQCANNKKNYLLLLDGFNEVTSDNSHCRENVRALLSHEISKMSKLPNVRIITTSRVTQYANYANDFTRVHLKGLEDKDIKHHLRLSNFDDILIEQILSNRNLKKCLSVPLFLCMFSIKNDYYKVMPETYGEILSNFFHKNGNFYSLLKRSKEAYNDPFINSSFVAEFIIDFIIPYIGWYYVQNDTFSLNKDELYGCIEKAVKDTQSVLNNATYIPIEEFDYDIKNVHEALYSFRSIFTKDKSRIVDCIHGYLGILYEFKSINNDSVKYSFIHHYFRDYFSAIWIIVNLQLIPHSNKHISLRELHESINIKHWNKNEAEVVGQILQEHRNKPYLSDFGNWCMPSPLSREQSLLTEILEYCRIYKPLNPNIGVLLQNIITTFYVCRGELSGINFDRLDLSKCNFHNMTCSKKGINHIIAASFRESRIGESTFVSREHNDSVMEYLYVDNLCITIDSYKNIKVWDVQSGIIVKEFINKEDCEFEGFSTKGFIKISPDHNLLGVRFQSVDSYKVGSYIKIYSLSDSGESEFNLKPKTMHKIVNDFVFTSDSNSVYVVCDSKKIYKFDIKNKNRESKNINPSMQKTISDLGHTIFLYSGIAQDSIYLFSCDYNPEDYFYADIESDDIKDDEVSCDEDIETKGIRCDLLKWNPPANTFENIHTYYSSPYTLPVIEYIPDVNSFVYYDFRKSSIVSLNCDNTNECIILSSVMEENCNKSPEYIHYSKGENSICYFMYPNICYQIKMVTAEMAYVIEEFNLPALESGQLEDNFFELTFVTNTAPSRNRFLLWNKYHETYEWHIDNGQPQYKYNTLKYDTVALLPDYTRDIFILVHAENGISIFSQNTFELIGAMCFPENDYKIISAEYSSVTGELFLLFERGEHNFIRKTSIDNSKSIIVFSGLKPSDYDTQLSLSTDGMYLLITTTQYCREYSVEEDKLRSVYEAQLNEELTTSYYVDDYIHVGVAMARESLSPSFDPRCEIYHRESNSYVFEYGYMIPTLTNEMNRLFFHKNHDVGVQCCISNEDVQNYWVTKGFFANNTSQIRSFLNLTKIGRKNRKIVELGKFSYPLFQMIQVRHVHPIENKRIVNSNNTSFSYLSPDYSKIMCIFDYEIIHYWDNMKNNLKRYTVFNYKDTVELSEGGSTIWDYAIPIKNNHFICCADSYRLFPVKSDCGEFEEEIEYTPGLSICGCKFKGADAPDHIKEMISQNGGIIKRSKKK